MTMDTVTSACFPGYFQRIKTAMLKGHEQRTVRSIERLVGVLTK